MAQRVVHRLEVIEIEAKRGNRTTALHAAQRFLHCTAEADAVGQTGERIVVRQERDLGLRAPALRDVLMRGNRRAIRQGAVGYGNDLAVAQLIDGVPRLAAGDGLQPVLDNIFRVPFADIAKAMLQDRAKRRPRSHVLRRDFVEVSVALVADDELLLGIVHAQPVRHIADGRVEAIILLADFSFRGIRSTADARRRARRSSG